MAFRNHWPAAPSAPCGGGGGGGGGGGARRRRRRRAAAARTPTPSNEREPGTSPQRTGPFPSLVRLAVGDDDYDELAMELAAEFGIEMMCV